MNHFYLYVFLNICKHLFDFQLRLLLFLLDARINSNESITKSN